MKVDRWRVAGVAAPNSRWFFELTRWSTAAAVPVDFIKCVSASELRKRLSAGETYSALLIGTNGTALTRDLVEEARHHGVAVIVVADGSPQRWTELGAVAELPEAFTRDELICVLTEHAAPVVRHPKGADSPALPPGWKGRLIAVTGSGGTGTSVLAMALAQGLAGDASNRGLVLLADMSLDAIQTVIHDSRDVIPGAQELVEACQGGWIGRDRLRSHVFEPAGRGYHLLLGLRRRRDRVALSKRPLETAMRGMIGTYRFVVADIDDHFEGNSSIQQAESGDPGLLASAVAARADLVTVVGAGDTLGLYSLTRTVVRLTESGIAVERLLPVINKIPHGRHRCRVAREALGQLLESTAASGVSGCVCVRAHRGVEPALRDGVAVPVQVGRALTAAITQRLRATGRSERSAGERGYGQANSVIGTQSVLVGNAVAIGHGSL